MFRFCLILCGLVQIGVFLAFFCINKYFLSSKSHTNKKKNVCYAQIVPKLSVASEQICFQNNPCGRTDSTYFKARNSELVFTNVGLGKGSLHNICKNMSNLRSMLMQGIRNTTFL